MPDLFTPYTLKGVTLRNRIAMSPMTMHRATDGRRNDFQVMLMGSRAAGGFGLVFPEQNRHHAGRPHRHRLRRHLRAARELAHPDPLFLLPEDWSWWLRNRPGPEGSLGWPAAAAAGGAR
jgi:NADH:flavin oxidoreductase / NADH oxidase family